MFAEPQMSGSHAEDIVGDYFEGDDWAELVDAESEPDLDLPPLPPPPGSGSA
jgi:hypothetical protein